MRGRVRGMGARGAGEGRACAALLAAHQASPPPPPPAAATLRQVTDAVDTPPWPTARTRRPMPSTAQTRRCGASACTVRCGTLALLPAAASVLLHRHSLELPSSWCAEPD